MDAFYDSPEWRALRARAIERDGSRCTVARLLGGACRGDLHVHHIVPRSEDPGRELDLDNLGTVCASHHPRWEAVRRLLVVYWTRPLPPCRHRHPYRIGREACESQRRRERFERRAARLASA